MINEDELVLEARDVAFEYFHVLYRLKDFIVEEDEEEDEYDDDDEKPVVDGFQEVLVADLR